MIHAEPRKRIHHEFDHLRLHHHRRPAQRRRPAAAQGGHQCPRRRHPPDGTELVQHGTQSDHPAADPGGAGLLRRFSGRVDHRPVARRRVAGLSHALAGLHRHRAGRLVVPGRSDHAPAHAGDGRDHRRRGPDGAYLNMHLNPAASPATAVKMQASMPVQIPENAMTDSLPFLPFSRPSIDEDTIAMVGEVLRSGWLTNGGPKVAAFEAQLSEYFGGRPVRTFNSGTCTMEIALRIAGIGPGDEVITTTISWVATANVILEVGATPVFADIDPVTRNIDLAQVEAAITPRTKAIIPVYLAGLPVDMPMLYALANKYNLRIVEDAAQALGSSWDGERIGATGDFVSFSFQANKNITSSEGGCLVLNNADEARLAEKYRLQGVTRTGFDGLDVDVLGGKFNMTDIAAAIGLGQFAHIQEITAHRQNLARHYFKCFGSDFEEQYGAQLPPADFENSNWHLFQLVLPERQDGLTARATFMEQMQAHGVGIGYHYPPIHLLSLYRAQGFKEGMFPVAERVGRLIVSLPMFTAMTEADVERSVAAVKAVLQR